MATAIRSQAAAVPRAWARDGVFVALAAVHGLLLIGWPSMLLVGIGLWWNANTIAHNFIHRPFFRSRGGNALFSAYLSLVLGVPQRLWRARHLAHHAEDHGAARTIRWTAAMTIETALVVAFFGLIAWMSPRGFFTIYAPGWLLGMFLCTLQGYFEHARGRTTSHYGWLYNALFFNDGYHVEHHAKPGEAWTNLPAHVVTHAPHSRWPAVVRWLDWFNLASLERLVLRRPRLQAFVLRTHERALRRLVSEMPSPNRVTIVGGGLFPRTAMILRRLWPAASLEIVDVDAEHIEIARAMLGPGVNLERGFWDPKGTETADLVVVPLAFEGDRDRLYTRPPAPAVIVHDWIWRRHESSVVVSWLLLKRLNLVRR